MGSAGSGRKIDEEEHPAIIFSAGRRRREEGGGRREEGERGLADDGTGRREGRRGGSLKGEDSKSHQGELDGRAREVRRRKDRVKEERMDEGEGEEEGGGRRKRRRRVGGVEAAGRGGNVSDKPSGKFREAPEETERGIKEGEGGGGGGKMVSMGRLL